MILWMHRHLSRGDVGSKDGSKVTFTFPDPGSDWLLLRGLVSGGDSSKTSVLGILLEIDFGEDNFQIPLDAPEKQGGAGHRWDELNQHFPYLP